MWLSVRGDVDVHGKFDILKDGRCTNFIRTLNVFLQAVCFPIFGCMSEATSDKYLRPEGKSTRSCQE